MSAVAACCSSTSAHVTSCSAKLPPTASNSCGSSSRLPHVTCRPQTSSGIRCAAVQTTGNGTATTAKKHEWRVFNNVLTAPAPGRLVQGATAFTEEHRVRANEVGTDQRTSIVTIADLMQEVAGNHGVALYGRTEKGFATDPLMVEKNLIFAATRIQINMDTYPKWGDTLRLETWFQADGRIAAQRDWLLHDAVTGKLLGRATSSWVMLNHLTRKISKIPEDLREKISSFSPQPHKSVFAPEDMRVKIPELPDPPALAGPDQSARRIDVDMNGHVNNVTFMAWALEAVPLDVYESCHLQQLEIDFKAECHVGHALQTLAHPVDENTNGTGSSRFTHSLRRKDDGCEVVRVRTTWRPRI